MQHNKRHLAVALLAVETAISARSGDSDKPRWGPCIGSVFPRSQRFCHGLFSPIVGRRRLQCWRADWPGGSVFRIQQRLDTPQRSGRDLPAADQFLRSELNLRPWRWVTSTATAFWIWRLSTRARRSRFYSNANGRVSGP